MGIDGQSMKSKAKMLDNLIPKDKIVGDVEIT